MSINFQTLKCGECGSGTLKRTAPNQYTCAHCASVSVVEDDVSDRLDRVLEQVKNAAADRLASEQTEQARRVMRGFTIAGGVFFAVMIFIFVMNAIRGTVDGKPGGSNVVTSLGSSGVPSSALEIVNQREVIVSNRPKLLVTVRNNSEKPLERAAVVVTFFAGERKLGEHSDDVPIRVLGADEVAPILIDMPDGATRHEVKPGKLQLPYAVKPGILLTLSRARLVQQGSDTVRFVGKLVNQRDVTVARCEILVTAYDDNGGVVGIGHTYGDASELAPGESTSAEARLTRVATNPIASWDYRIDYEVVDADKSRTAISSSNRVIRIAAGPEIFNDDLHLSTDDLLADDAERFDTQQLELTPLVTARNNIREPVYLTEVVNRSSDTIVVEPGAVISAFDGSKLDGATKVAGIAYLYPGERFPVRIEPRGNRVTQTRVEWKPMRRSALPGTRPQLTVHIDGTSAQMGSVLLNFSQRFVYKYVDVRGTVKNIGSSIVRKPKVWVSLRDGEGKLTGFKLVENLPAIAAGDSAPFEVSVEQQGKDFKTVTTLFDAD